MTTREISCGRGAGSRMTHLLLLLSATLVACTTGGDGSIGYEVHDSVGVRVVVNSDYQWLDGMGWRLSDTPVLDIGVLEGDDNYQFFRVVDAAALSDGRIVVSNGGTQELRFFDAEGTFLFSTGRKGGGPGEFEALWTISVLSGDSIMAFDRRLRRMSVFAPDGSFARSFMFPSLAGAAAFPMLLGVTDQGSLVVSERAFDRRVGTGLARDSSYYLLTDMEGALLDTLGFFPGSEWYVKSEGEGVVSANPPFGRSSVHAVSGDGFYFGSTDSYAIAYYGSSGILQRIVRRNKPNLEVTNTDLERNKQGRLQRYREPSERQFWERIFHEMPVPKTMPAHDSIIVDANGNLWVSEYRRPGDEQPRWTIFDSEGVMLGEVETPTRFRIYEIGSDYVLGRGLDELDVQHIQIYDLIKNK